jgi:hypothetical protein
MNPLAMLHHPRGPRHSVCPHSPHAGIVWECPLLAELPEVPGYQGAGSAGPAGASASAAGGTGSGPLQASRSMAQRSGSMARGGGGGGAAAGEGGGQQRGELQRQTTGRRRGAGAGPAPASTSQDQQQQQGDGAGGTAGQQQQQPRGDGGPAAGATGISGAAAGSGSASGAPKYPRRFFFCLSPDACTNPTLYYLGPFIPHSDQAALREAVKAGLTTTRPDGPAIKDPPGGQLCGKFLVGSGVGWGSVCGTFSDPFCLAAQNYKTEVGSVGQGWAVGKTSQVVLWVGPTGKFLVGR